MHSPPDREGAQTVGKVDAPSLFRITKALVEGKDLLIKEGLQRQAVLQGQWIEVARVLMLIDGRF